MLSRHLCERVLPRHIIPLFVGDVIAPMSEPTLKTTTCETVSGVKSMFSPNNLL